MMARPCSICTHSQRSAIDQALVGGTPFRAIAEQYGTSAGALSRHLNSHLGATIAQAQAAAQAQVAETVQRQQAGELHQALDVVQQLRAINGVCLRILADARQNGQNGLALQAVDRVTRQIELQAKLLGQLDERAQVNVLVASPEWLRLRELLLHALSPFPAARFAVAAALAEEEL